MADFSGPTWTIVIIIATLGGIAGLWLLIVWQSRIGASDQKETTGHVWDEDLTELNNPLPLWWRNLFYITLVFGVIYLILYPGLGSFGMLLKWTQVKEYEQQIAEAEARYGPIFEKYLNQPVERIVQDPEALKIGERLYASYCTVCHGSDAGGVIGFPNLRDDRWLYGGTPDAIETSILKGRNGVMPGWKTALGGDQGVDEMVAYVLSLSGRDVDAAKAAAGKTKYGIFCIGCHGPEETGNQQLGAPNLTDDTWLYGGSAEAVAATIANGRNGVMPAHEEFLGNAKVHLLAAYIYSLSNQ
jgi:cytochrome c oxidase cbb3-type subunit 3